MLLIVKLKTAHPKRNKKNNSCGGSIIWTKTKNETEKLTSLFSEGNSSLYNKLSEVDLFKLFFDETIFLHIKNEMTKYCVKKNWSDVSVSVNELKVFFGILIVTGYNELPRRRLYWTKSSDVYNEAISNSMRRDRFEEIIKCLHFNALESYDKNDKYAKLRPLITHLQSKFMENFVPEQNISHDEAMVEYFGKHSC